MTRREKEKITVKQMVEIYCHGKEHCKKGFCNECSDLLEYAYVRLDHCKFEESKPTCKKCPVHCYKPELLEQMRKVMRYAGPRMIWHHPITAIRHIFREFVQ